MAPIPFGKTVVETNRGLTVTIESSPATSPEKASLNHGWNPEIPGGAAFPFPDIAPQPQFAGGSLQLAPGKPRVRPIVRGTQEANESFERMKHSLASSPCMWKAAKTLKVLLTESYSGQFYEHHQG